MFFCLLTLLKTAELFSKCFTQTLGKKFSQYLKDFYYRKKVLRFVYYVDYAYMLLLFGTKQQLKGKINEIHIYLCRVLERARYLGAGRVQIQSEAFCVMCACSPHECVGSIQVLRLPPKVQQHGLV